MFAQFLLLALLSALQVIDAVGIPRTDNHLIKPFIGKVYSQATTNHQNDVDLKVDFLRQGIVKREVSNGIEKDALCGIVYPDYPYICADRSWCLAVSQICDDVISCYDGSDEEGCQDDADIRVAGGETQQVRKAFHDDNGCARSFPLFPLRCARNSNMCVSREQICDGLGQCPDYNDEIECEYGFGETDFCKLPIKNGQVGCRGSMDLSFQVMDAQNYFRCMHGVGPLGWDQHLATVAEETARRNANNGRIRHSRRGYGENLAEIEIPDIHHASGFGVAKLWYDEIELYDFNRPRFTYKTGHVTQLLWADTIRVGCAVEYSHGAIFVACEYSPPGNVYGQYERNVYPPLYIRP